MKTVSKLFLLFFITLTSCNKKSLSTNKNQILNSTTSYVNYELDSVYYKINVGSENKNYYQDKRGNFLFLVTREVFLDNNKNLGGLKQYKWFNEAKKYVKNKDKKVYLGSKIGVKKIDGTYDYIWNYKSEITINNKGYGVYELQISLDDSYANYYNKLESHLHINFKTVDNDNGYKLYTLNYIYEDNQWHLVSRERICTIPKDINNEEIGYCIDTINSNCEIKANKFSLTYNNIFDLNNANCF